MTTEPGPDVSRCEDSSRADSRHGADGAISGAERRDREGDQDGQDLRERAQDLHLATNRPAAASRASGIADGTAETVAHGMHGPLLPRSEPAGTEGHLRGGPSATPEGSVPAYAGTRPRNCAACGHDHVHGSPCWVHFSGRAGGGRCVCGLPLRTEAAPLPAGSELVELESDVAALAPLGSVAPTHDVAADTARTAADLAAAAPPALDDVDELRAAILALRADARDQRCRADQLERELRISERRHLVPSPDEALGWGWRAGDLDTVIGPLPTREAAIAAATRHLEVLYAETTDVPAGSRERALIYVGRCVPWHPLALDAGGVLGALDAEAAALAPHLFAQVAPMEWTVRQRDDLGRRLRAALNAWLASIGHAPLWTMERREEAVHVEVVVPERAPAALPPRVVAAIEMPVGDGSRA